MRSKLMVVAAAAAAVGAGVLAGGSGAQGQAPPDPAKVGSFSQPFTEPTVSNFAGYPRVRTDKDCIERPRQPGQPPSTGPGVTRGFIDCKPAAGGLVQLPNGRNLYWDNLAGTENVELTILSEYGVVGLNDQTRVLDVNRKRWTEPTPVDAGAKSRPDAVEPLVPADIFADMDPNNDGSLFCADANFLADGRVLATGGTKYQNDPGNDASKFGSTELKGIENTRVFDPRTGKWSQTGSMHRPRWYPTVTTLGDGKQFVVTGLRRLVKAVNRTDPIDPTAKDPGGGVQEGQNERTTETYDPKTGKWTLGPNSARKSLPLFARMHLLPNGHVFYNSAGQAFNPLGQAYDQALWNVASSYDPAKKAWKDLGVPGQGTTPVPGYRGSTFSVMLPLRRGGDGRYTKASFLTGGGVTGGVAATSPGGYVALRDSFITTIDTARGNALGSEDAGDMNASSTPATGRWYGTGTLLPTGEVLATSGADRDEVAVPGFESPVMDAELYDPQTKKWRKAARQHRPRTYHNTAALRPDGKVLVGGHATISNAYLANRTLPGGVTAPNGRDPSFEVYSPPYLSCAGKQATIESVRGSGSTLTLGLDVPARDIKSVMLMRNTTVTHVVDADQRGVELQVLSRSGNTVTVRQPGSGNVAPPGPYMLFVNRQVGSSCLKPSRAAQVSAKAGGLVKPLAGCLARRSPIGPRNIGRVRLGLTRRGLLRSPRLARVGSPKTTGKRFRYCVKRSGGRVTAVFGRRGRVELVTTTAKGHGNRKVRRGASVAKLRKAFPSAKRVGRGLYRLSARSRRVAGVRKGKVRFYAVASKRVVRSRRSLRAFVRRAGL